MARNVTTLQGRRYRFWAPWTAYSLGPSCVPGGLGWGFVGVPLRTDRVLNSITFRGTINLPWPETLRHVSESLSELSARVRPEPVFFQLN